MSRGKLVAELLKDMGGWFGAMAQRVKPAPVREPPLILPPLPLPPARGDEDPPLPAPVPPPPPPSNQEPQRRRPRSLRHREDIEAEGRTEQDSDTTEDEQECEPRRIGTKKTNTYGRLTGEALRGYYYQTGFAPGTNTGQPSARSMNGKSQASISTGCTRVNAC